MPRCWAFLCDNDGQVTGDLRADFCGSSESISATSLVALIGPGRWKDFLEAVRTRGSIQEHELRIPFEGSVSSLLLNACLTASGVLVFAILGGTSRAGGDSGMAVLAAVHDFNNPISSIVGSCEYLTEYSRENLNPMQLEMISVIEKSARTLLMLSGRIAELSRQR